MRVPARGGKSVPPYIIDSMRSRCTLTSTGRIKSHYVSASVDSEIGRISGPEVAGHAHPVNHISVWQAKIEKTEP